MLHPSALNVQRRSFLVLSSAQAGKIEEADPAHPDGREAERWEAERVLARLASLPHRGETPIPIWMEVEKVDNPAAKGALSSRLVARLSPEALVDLAGFLRSEAVPHLP